MSRKLVSIQRIVSTEPIEGADRIEIARVLGWQCVTQKSNNFKPGDLVAYFEIDSLIPLNVTPFAFLRKKDTETEARIKTIKLKGKFAQGLILPLSVIDEALKELNVKREFEYEEDLDITELLGVKKYEQDTSASLGGNSLGLFPSFVSKTDETRIQSAPRVLIKARHKQVAVCEKLDGSSTTVFYVPKNHPGLPTKYHDMEEDMIFGVASRNLCLQDTPDNSFWRVVKELELKEKMIREGKPMVLQGELIGPGVQKNRLKLPKLEIRWFNAVNPADRTYYNHYTAREIFDSYNLMPVPTLSIMELNHTVDELVQMSIGNSVLNPTVKREGIVIRPLLEDQEADLGGRFSFKVINPEFLVHHGE